MVLGLSLAMFTLLHVLISLVGIGSGIMVVIGMLGSHRLPAWTAVYLVTTILTSPQPLRRSGHSSISTVPRRSLAASAGRRPPSS